MSHVHLTDERLLVVVRQADAEDYAQKILAGKKGEVMTTIHAKLSLDRTNFPTVPAKATVQSWLESALAKRKAAVGANADKEHTGDGSEDEVRTLPQPPAPSQRSLWCACARRRTWRTAGALRCPTTRSSTRRWTSC